MTRLCFSEAEPTDRLRPSSRLLLLVIVCALLLFAPTLVSAQATVDRTTAEFDASADHNATLADGTPVVDRYDLEFYLVGAASPFQVASMGKPASDADGKIRVSLSGVLSSYPSPGMVYEATVSPVWSGGHRAQRSVQHVLFLGPVRLLGLADELNHRGGGHIQEDGKAGRRWFRAAPLQAIQATAGATPI